jgi:hypothetical protein
MATLSRQRTAASLSFAGAQTVIIARRDWGGSAGHYPELSRIRARAHVLTSPRDIVTGNHARESAGSLRRALETGRPIADNPTNSIPDW